VKATLIVAVVLVGILSFGFSAFWSYLQAYVLRPPDPKFGRDGAFQLGVFVSAWMSVCFAVSFLATVPLYLRLFGHRSLRHLLLYSVAFVSVLCAVAWSEAISFLVAIFGPIIPEFSGNGLPEIILSFLAASLVAALLFCGFAFVAERPFRRRAVLP